MLNFLAFAFYIILWPACLNDMCQENGAYQPLTPVLLMFDEREEPTTKSTPPCKDLIQI